MAQRLRTQGHGTLVVLSSVAGERVRKANFVYGSSKAGLDGFAQGLGDSLVGSGARVMVVRPGFVHTKMTEGMDAAPFSTTPEVVADAIIDGLHKRRDVVWAPSQLRYVFSACATCPGRCGARCPTAEWRWCLKPHRPRPLMSRGWLQTTSRSRSWSTSRLRRPRPWDRRRNR